MKCEMCEMCEMCRMLEDLIAEIQPDKMVYSQYTSLSTAMEKVLDEHKDRVHNPEDKK